MTKEVYQTQNEKTKKLLSMLWVLLFANFVFCDLLSFMHCYNSADKLVCNLNGVNISQLTLLAYGILMEIPILMILVAGFCKHRHSRKLNIICAFLMIFVQTWSLTLGKVAMHQWFFSVIEIAICISIVFIAWKWKRKKIYVFQEK
ncbi:MAG: DUF6326 family protein [Paludibacter sp.]|nr:DUF6326 family protein [Paludibacter sp.]